MSTYTTYKSLEKPLSTEKYNIAVANENADKIDSELNKLDLKAQRQETALEAEIERATNADLNLKDNLTQEISRATGAENRLTTDLSAVSASIDTMEGRMTALTDRINNLRAEDIGALSLHSGGTITNIEGEALNISASGLSGHGNQTIDGFDYIDAHQILEDGKDIRSNYLQKQGDTMSGELDMGSNSIVNTKKIISSSKEIDLSDYDFEIGIRDSAGAWVNKLSIDGDGDVHIDNSRNHIHLSNVLTLNNDSGSQLKLSNASFELCNSSAGIHNSGGRLNIDANDSICVNTLDELRISAQDALEIGAGKKIYMYSPNEIRLVPGAGNKADSPVEGYYVKSGDIKGIPVNTSNGSRKPNIENFGNINAETFNGQRYLPLNGGTMEDNAAIHMNSDSIYGPGMHLFSYDPGRNYNTDIVPAKVDTPELVTEIVSPKNNTGAAKTIGTSSNKWQAIYAINGTIQTSDLNEKNNIQNISTDAAKAFILGLTPSTYKMNAGTSGRTHWGLIAQDVEELMERLGMDSKDFAGFIKSPHYEQQEIEEETADGEKVRKTINTLVEDQHDYSLRYDEFIAPMIKVIQDLSNRVEELEKSARKN